MILIQYHVFFTKEKRLKIKSEWISHSCRMMMQVFIQHTSTLNTLIEKASLEQKQSFIIDTSMIRGKIMKPLSTCEHCGDVHTIVLQEQRRRNGVVVGYTQCPACQHRAVFSVTTPQIREPAKTYQKCEESVRQSQEAKESRASFCRVFQFKGAYWPTYAAVNRSSK